VENKLKIFQSKVRKEILELRKAHETLLQKASINQTLYNISGMIQQGMDLQSKFKPETDSYRIYLTCGPVNTVINKIVKTISKFSWTSTSTKLLTFLENPNEQESFTSIIYKTMVDLLDYGEAFWDIANRLIYNISPQDVAVTWGKSLKEVDYQGKKLQVSGEKVYKSADGTITYEKEEIVHFILEPNSKELRGISKLRSIQNEINLYYYICDSANKKYNRNELPRIIINLGASASSDQIKAFRTKFLNLENPNDPPVGNFDKCEVIQLNKDQGFGADYIAIQEWFEKRVFSTFGMSETDLGLVSSTRASAEVHQEQTTSTLIDPILDNFAETFNRSLLVKWYGGDFKWEKPDIEEDVEENNPDEKSKDKNKDGRSGDDDSFDKEEDDKK